MRNIINRQNTSIGALAVLAVAGANMSAIAQGSLVGQTRCVKQSTAIFTDRSATSAVVRAVATNQSVILSENAAQNGFIGVSSPTPGFVQTVNLKLCSGASPAPVPTPTPTTPPATASLCRRVSQEQGLLVRQGPGPGSALVGGVTQNTQVFLTTSPATTRTDADGRIWVQINKPLSGWVANGYKDASRGSNLVSCQ
jgi:Bacterial SH3 domain